MATPLINQSTTSFITPIHPNTSSINAQLATSSNFLNNVTVSSSSNTPHILATSEFQPIPLKTSEISTTSTQVIPASSSIYNVSTTTTVVPPMIPKSKKSLLVYYVGIPVGIIGLFMLIMVSVRYYFCFFVMLITCMKKSKSGKFEELYTLFFIRIASIRISG